MIKFIETERLVLYPCTQQMAEAAIQGNKALAKLLQVNVPQVWTEFGAPAFTFTLEKMRLFPDEFGWLTYLPVYKPDNMLVGSCGYTGKPDAGGMVEIGYEVAPHYRNRGIATEIASALIAHAFEFNEVLIVQAHTLAEKNASGKVLQNCGMILTDEIMHPQDGKLWLWKLHRNQYNK
ncbi:N-acetyltransferase [Sphingobacteriales bacterium UPWRP_1]|nr:hypothetical protein B6N25_05885 [Sphingobacteriales bacterium TSM_CSS]PSJ74635.1 N-acetyltransferase [Sphingobacteriales bacterium UPWRP_1]